MSKKKPHQNTVEAEPEITLDSEQKTEETTIDQIGRASCRERV